MPWSNTLVWQIHGPLALHSKTVSGYSPPSQPLHSPTNELETTLDSVRRVLPSDLRHLSGGQTERAFMNSVFKEFTEILTHEDAQAAHRFLDAKSSPFSKLQSQVEKHLDIILNAVGIGCEWDEAERLKKQIRYFVWWIDDIVCTEMEEKDVLGEFKLKRLMYQRI